MRSRTLLVAAVGLAVAWPASAQPFDKADEAAARKEASREPYMLTPFPLVQKLADKFAGHRHQDPAAAHRRRGGAAALHAGDRPARPGADVMTMSDAGAANGLAKQGMFVPFKPEGFDKVVDGAKDRRATGSRSASI